MVFPISKRTLFPLVGLFIRKITGIKNIPQEGPFIVVANHDSYADPFIITSVILKVLNKKIHFLAMKGRFWNKFGNTVSRKWAGCIPLDEGKKKALEEMKNLLKKGEVIGLFPGGPRSSDGSLPRGKTGSVRLALATKAPILPIGIDGAYDIAPGDKLIPKLKRCEVNIGKLIYITAKKKVTKKLLDDMTSNVMRQIAILSKKN